jgi:hypothetical protein
MLAVRDVGRMFPRLLTCSMLCGIVTSSAGAQEASLPEVLKPATSQVSISKFGGFRADYERFNNLRVQGREVTAEREFTQDDVGKILVVKEARSYREYRLAPVTLNAVVDSVRDGRARVTSFDEDGVMLDATGKPGFLATDNWAPLQAAIQHCEKHGISQLTLDFTGTAYVVPARHPEARFAVRSSANQIATDMQIRGLGKMQTKLKYGAEDIQKIDHRLQHDYSAFYVRNARFRLEDLTLESADRTSTELDVQNVKAINSEPQTGTSRQSIYCDRVDILSPDPDWALGWGAAMYMNNNSTLVPGTTAVMEFKNGTIKAQSGLAFFNAASGDRQRDEEVRIMRIHDAEIFAGARYVRHFATTQVTAGSDVIKVLNAPEFSWYDFTEYEQIGTNFREPVVTLTTVDTPINNPFTGQRMGGPDGLGTSQAYVSKVIEILSPTEARIKIQGTAEDPGIPRGLPNAVYQAPAFTTKSANLYTSRYSQERWAAFHGAYRSGNVGIDGVNVKCHALRYSMRSANVRPPAVPNVVHNFHCVQDVSYPAAEKLRLLIMGAGYGTNAQECGFEF